MRWDQVSQPREVVVAGVPLGMTFDGAHIWVVSTNGDKVTQIRAVDGDIIRTIDLPAGSRPYAAAFDGQNVWVTDTGTNSVSRINVATGAKQEFPVGNAPRGIAFDGTNIFVVNSEGNSVIKLATDGTMVPGGIYGVVTSPLAIAFDGSSMWVTSTAENQISKISASGSITNLAANHALSATFDGTSIWTASTAGFLDRFSIADNARTTFNTSYSAFSVLFDGTSIWYAAIDGVYKMKIDGTNAGSFTTSGTPQSLSFDGANLWVSLPNENKVVKIPQVAVAAPALTVAAESIQDGAVTTNKLADNAVTNAKIANGAVTGAKIAANTITGENISGPLPVAVGGTGQSTLAANKLLVGNGTDGVLAPNNLHWDNTNSRLGIGTASPSEKLEVAGTVKASALVGDGSGLTNINYAKVAIVGQSGAKYTSPVDAMSNVSSGDNWCGDPSATNPCLVKILPGVYDLAGGTLTMQSYVDIEGSGENTTVITSAVSTTSPPANGTVNGASNAELRFLTVENKDTGFYAAAIVNSGSSPRISNVTATATAPCPDPGSVRRYGVYNSSSSPTMTNVTATADGFTIGAGIDNSASSGSYTILIDRSTLKGQTYSIRNDSHYTLKIWASKLENLVTNGGTITYISVHTRDGILMTGANVGIGTIYPMEALDIVGNLKVSGTITGNGGLNVTGGTKNFLIDHPLDPKGKVLRHAAIESNEVLNVYRRNVVLDGRGNATVRLPAWFDVINRDLSYQLTPVGGPASSLHVASEVQDNSFTISGGTPGLKVSWQVTGVRNDPVMRANPFVVEEEKPAPERGVCLHPAACDGR